LYKKEIGDSYIALKIIKLSDQGVKDFEYEHTYFSSSIVKLNGNTLFQIFGQQKFSAPEGLYLYGSVGKYDNNL
jgi:predicted ATPase